MMWDRMDKNIKNLVYCDCCTHYSKCNLGHMYYPLMTMSDESILLSSLMPKDVIYTVTVVSDFLRISNQKYEIYKLETLASWTRNFQSQYQDATEVALRTGHKSLKSLESYMNLHGILGKQQKSAVLEEQESTERSAIATSSENSDSDYGALKKGPCRNDASAPAFTVTGGNVVININYHHSHSDNYLK